MAAGSLELRVLSPLLPVVFGLYTQAGLTACPDAVNWWEGSAEPCALLSQSRHRAGGGLSQSRPLSLGQSGSSPFSLLYLFPHP